MAHTSTINVLKVSKEERTSKGGDKFDVMSAEVLILTDDGQIEASGAMRLTKDLYEGLTPGMYRAGFSMARQAYGDRRGDIVSQLVSLQPVPTRNAPAAAKPAP